MTSAERRESVRQFINRWNGKGNEQQDAQKFWIEVFEDVLGVENATKRLDFEKYVIVDGHPKRIDVYIPETHVLIEQKSLGIDLNKPGFQSGGDMLTPYGQAKRYNDNLPYNERARWIITSNFAEIWIYDMDAKVPEPFKIQLTELRDKYPKLDLLTKREVKRLTDEMTVSIKAGELVGLMYDAFAKEFGDMENERNQKALNALCVRLVFCLYAEDAEIFGRKDQFHDYLSRFEARDMRRALVELFKVLNIPEDKRDPFLEPELAEFPYVNGGLFDDDNPIIPPFTDETRALLIDRASMDFDWSDISPTIFGAVFESTLNPATRRSNGQHFTSIENIHKVIDPLFLNDLEEEFETLIETKQPKTRIQKLDAFQNKLAGLKFLDPAAGSGNFLTETYLSLRRLENEVLKEKEAAKKGAVAGQISFGDLGKDAENPIKVSIQQFYGIEINDFACTVAKTALWIAESQMMKQTEDVLHLNLDFLPLKSYVNITEGNALRIDWNDVLPASQCFRIMGNPPFIGARLMSAEQKKDVGAIFAGWKNAGNLDYVACWYKKAIDYMKNTDIRSALVSTNSVCQGETVANLWKPLFDIGVHIDFAHRTFIWDSEASIKAHVHCVIVGFSISLYNGDKYIYDGETKTKAENINAYLVDAENVFAESRSKPLCDVPEMLFGSMPNDGGYLSNYDKEQKHTIVQKYPDAENLFKPLLGAEEFLHSKERFCLWLKDVSPNEYRNIPPIMSAIQKVKEKREASKRAATKKLAEVPYLFGEIRQPKNDYLVIPEVSSEKRRYVPVGFLNSNTIVNNRLFTVANATLYTFGIVTSNVHMAWMRTVCGRLESRYNYSIKVVYNNFPWPTPTDDQKAKIEQSAQAILDARALYPDSSLADLYDPLTMPPELRKAHTWNDKNVMAAYGFSTKMTEAECVAELMKMYQKLVDGQEA